MKTNDSFISVICPISNQADMLDSFIVELSQALSGSGGYHEIILIDNGSTDKTRVVMESILKMRPSVRYIRLTRRFSSEAAIAAGLDHAIGDVITVMAPGFDPPAMIMELVSEARKTNEIFIGNLVTGVPVAWKRKVADKFISWTLSKTLHFPLAHRTTYFLVFNRTTLNLLNSFRDRVRFIKAFAGLAGVPVRYFDYQPVNLKAEPTGRVRDQLRNMLDLVISNSIVPLRVVTLGGLLASVLNLAYIGYVICIALFKSHVAEGWVTLSLQSAGTFFILSLVLAVLGEYMGALLLDSKGRPPYFVLEDRHSAVMIEYEAQRRNIVTMSVSGE
jgi:glycosyltransferase involved in cell wall biosynthesis